MQWLCEPLCISSRLEQGTEPSDIRVGAASGVVLAMTSAVSAGVGVGAAAGASANEAGGGDGVFVGDFGDSLSSMPHKSNMFTIGATTPRDDPQR